MRSKNWLRASITIAAAGLLALTVGGWRQEAAVPGPVGPEGYRLSKVVPLPDNGSWDYLRADSEARRLYIAHQTEIVVVNLDDQSVAGTIKDTPGVHGVAVSDKDGHGFTSNGGNDTSTMFNTKTLQVIRQVPLPKKGADGIIYDPATDRIFIFCGDSNSAIALDAKTGDVAGTIDLGGGPEFAAADGRGHVFNVLEDKSELLDIDAKGLTVLHRYPLDPCESPSGVAIDAAHHRVFAGCRNQVMAIVNADTGKVIDAPKIGSGVDAARFDPATQLAFASNGDGTITVIHEDSPDKFTELGNITTEPRARTMALDTKTHTLYSVTSKFGAPPAAAPAGGRGRGRAPMVPGSFVLLVITK